MKITCCRCLRDAIALPRHQSSYIFPPFCATGEILNVRFYCALICGENPRCAREGEEKALIMMYAKRWLDLIARDKLLGGRFMLAVLNFTDPRLWHFPNLPP
ncbi:hypothetical protein AVEN_136057-1 [Araneus ventricosus]|uniref:Uncharacterized protein n=1 Tax=Araneus ventricosus TaxID=182803 RepID=A0A4Y2IUH6_ARAVE|nr:hypothetical protein AVEN_121072-1 [Araneus ventricosus]GBM80591.1 hypothetical protein AVEN_136057-1 [Araneus ventricosus]